MGNSCCVKSACCQSLCEPGWKQVAVVSFAVAAAVTLLVLGMLSHYKIACGALGKVGATSMMGAGAACFAATALFFFCRMRAEKNEITRISNDVSAFRKSGMLHESEISGGFVTTKYVMYYRDNGERRVHYQGEDHPFDHYQDLEKQGVKRMDSAAYRAAVPQAEVSDGEGESDES